MIAGGVGSSRAGGAGRGSTAGRARTGGAGRRAPSEDFRSAWITILDLSREASPGAYLPRFANI
jgi:hypothetical protein